MAWFWCYGYRINRWVSEWDLTLITDRKWHNGLSLTLWLSVIRDVSTSKSLVSILDPQIESSYLTISKNPVTHYDQLKRTRDWFHLNIYWHWQCILLFDNPWVTLFPTVSKKNLHQVRDESIRRERKILFEQTSSKLWKVHFDT